MKRSNITSIALALTIGSLTTLATAQSINVTTKNGSRWRGQVNDTVSITFTERGVQQTLDGKIVKAGDRYLIIEAMINGAMRQKTLFFGDIMSIAGSDAAPAVDAASGAATASASSSSATPSADSAPSTNAPTKSADGKPLGVFYLPLDGGVGEGIRHDEIKKIGEEADKYGPGQIIILQVNTNGGLVLEAELIDETIQDLQKRHRVIAWIKKAISAGCSLAMACSEIYFMTEGTAGSVTTVRGTASVSEEEAMPGIEALVETAKRNGYSEHVARSMKLNKYMCSYDKDPVTGDVTWYGDLSGEYILSDDKSNLCFNSSNALHCGFSKGTADTPEQLAKLLDLPEWREISTYGRKIAKDWQDTANRATEEIQKLMARRGYWGTSGDAVERIGKLIRIDEELLRWIDRAPNIAIYNFGLDKEQIQREIVELRKRLADIQRDQRRG